MSGVDDLNEFPVLIKEFSEYKLSIQGCSKKTVSEYLFDLRTFCRYMVCARSGTATDEESLEKADIKGLTLEFFDSIKKTEIFDFTTFVTHSRANGTAARSRKLSAIRSFYTYLTKTRNLTEKNPAKEIDSPKKKKQLPKHLSLEECIELLSSVKNDETSKTRERDYCILTLFLNCGMRLSELCGISLGDIDREMTLLRVLGKGAKERVVYLNDACRSAIKDYLPVRLSTKTVGERENALFISRLGKRISVKTVQWMVKKYLGEAGLEYKHYSTHKLRHTAATLMYQSGEVDIRVLKDILGHEQLNTTQIYTHVSNQNMEDAMTHNPLARVIIKEKPKKAEDAAENDDKEE